MIAAESNNREVLYPYTVAFALCWNAADQLDGLLISPNATF